MYCLEFTNEPHTYRYAGRLLGDGHADGLCWPCRAQENTANATVDQDQANTQANEQSAAISAEKKADTTVDQSNTQASEQNQTGVADATADQDITVDANVSVEQPETPSAA